MSEDAGAEGESLYAAVREAAGLLGVACSRDMMRPVLTAFRDVIASTVVLNAVTSGGRVDDVSFDFTMPPGAGDPYEIALARGLTGETSHPIRALFSDLRKRFPVSAYGVDYGINRGFNKAYLVFPLGGFQELAGLVDVPSMPVGLSAHADAFAEYGLDGKVSAIAIDYAHRTWNVYFNGLGAGQVERGAVLSMVREFGLPEPSGQLLDFIGTSSAVYPTFGWDSPEIERISFSVRTTDPAAVLTHADPVLENFAGKVPYAYGGDRVLVCAGALSADEEYYKLAAYYRMTSETRDRVQPAN
ncbi:aromatic prenyltransferase [Streptomyces qinzhouensis]|uniref:aromatic prenyltransferase n=1 Tax=Streptomyces qinzhouensis TaxID=2599401 RepID=UPI001FEA22F4|nr:aromatic prenyltransferase [Streptomyces qinzhouensis]